MQKPHDNSKASPTALTQDTTLIAVVELSLHLPKNVVPEGRRMKPRIRADLNKYRQILIDRVTKQMAEQEGLRKNKETGKFAYKIKEDAPKIVEDLYIFHKTFFHKKDEEKKKQRQDANLARCATLNELHEVVGPYRPKYPLQPEERFAAHAAFLKTGTPKELENLLPEGWKATEEIVTAPDGRVWTREGGAKLVEELESGTQVIQLLSEKASLAYGSPRWCTAYRSYGIHTSFVAFANNQPSFMASKRMRPKCMILGPGGL
jgi:hypothetical protein